MPLTHVDIEERTRRNIACLFCFLVTLYIGSLSALWSLSWLWRSDAHPTWQRWLMVVGIAVAASLLHWAFASYRLVDRVLDALNARAASPADTYHATLIHIVEEVTIAMGGRRIEPYVIPTPAVNACAVSASDGRAALAVTEGALALLNRDQLQAVVGHEAAHIASGDSVTASLVCGLFALHEEALREFCGLWDLKPELSEAGGLFGLLVRARTTIAVGAGFVILWVTVALKTLTYLLISREQEYHADAVAVQLTRQPLSLAEALQLMSKKWRGVGTRGASLSNLFIMDPGTELFSEQEGFFADLFATHPPTARRIERLTGMAHLDPRSLDETWVKRQERPRRLPPPSVTSETSPPQWMIWRDNAWQGPVNVEAVAHLGMTPNTWVRRVEEETTRPAARDPLLSEALQRQYGGLPAATTACSCPNCLVPLVTVAYEGVRLEECPACHGHYVDPEAITKIFTRKEYDFPEAIKRQGDLLLAMRRQRWSLRGVPRVPLQRSCPKCGSGVVRKFYTEAYPVEVEQCWVCGLTWLDAQELELLQYLYERYEQRREQEEIEEGPTLGEAPPVV